LSPRWKKRGRIRASKRLKKINFVTHREDGQFRADDYELKLEGLDINTAVNFIYRISSTGVFVKVRKCSMTVSLKTGLLNISLLVLTFYDPKEAVLFMNLFDSLCFFMHFLV